MCIVQTALCCSTRTNSITCVPNDSLTHFVTLAHHAPLTTIHAHTYICTGYGDHGGYGRNGHHGGPYGGSSGGYDDRARAQWHPPSYALSKHYGATGAGGGYGDRGGWNEQDGPASLNHVEQYINHQSGAHRDHSAGHAEVYRPRFTPPAEVGSGSQQQQQQQQQHQEQPGGLGSLHDWSSMQQQFDGLWVPGGTSSEPCSAAEGYLASDAAKAEVPQHGVAGSLLKEEGQQGSAGGILKELVGDTRTRSTVDIIDIGSIGSIGNIGNIDTLGGVGRGGGRREASTWVGGAPTGGSPPSTEDSLVDGILLSGPREPIFTWDHTQSRFCDFDDADKPPPVGFECDIISTISQMGQAGDEILTARCRGRAGQAEQQAEQVGQVGQEDAAQTAQTEERQEKEREDRFQAVQAAQVAQAAQGSVQISREVYLDQGADCVSILEGSREDDGVRRVRVQGLGNGLIGGTGDYSTASPFQPF